ncbi:MAG TPA: OsmC family protein [Acidimicrobiales bacterium]|jgi:lipoyl-dependent peroxiredoxin|nr:OsmC family protein [Acidimicrobiales bacterium]
MPTRTADAQWEGALKDGSGTMRFGSGAYEGAYTFASRFEEGTGTNPEELIAAAHAGCFSMQFSALLDRAGHRPTRVRTSADVHLDKGEAGFSVTSIDLHTEGEVPGIEDAEFQTIADEAKRTCPVSRLLTGATINVEAKLV